MTHPSDAPTSPSVNDPQNGTIGRADEPTRVLSFASGGFETTRQLGAVHALLVSRARAPDMVIGASAGAINAVAAAEILQAGRCEARVARFREIFESYQNCPGDLAAAMLPDTYEIDVHRPLEQLRLPIHAETERENRGTSLDSKAGLLNLYNDLLRLRISIGTATRFIRRYLGLAAAGAEPNPLKRWLARLLELFRTWVLVGYNLAELAPLGGMVVRAAFGWRRREKGAPAAHLIFHSRLFGRSWAAANFVVSFVSLLAAWLLLSMLLLLVLAGLLHVVSLLTGYRPMQLGAPPGLDPSSWRPTLRRWPETLAALDVVLGLSAAVVLARKQRAASRHPKGADPLLAIVGVVLAIALVGLGFVVVKVLASIPKQELGDAGRVLLHDALVAGTATLLLGLVIGLGSALRRETSRLDELLGILGSSASFLAINGAVFATLAALVWSGALRDGSDYPLRPLAIGLLIVFQVVVFGVIGLIWCGPVLPLNLLRRYDLDNGLGSEHPIRQFFVRLFDREYYGQIPMDAVLERAMEYSDQPFSAEDGGARKPAPKRFRDYDAPGANPPIHVAVTAASVGGVPDPGQNPTLQVLPAKTEVVNGLLAATAVTPLLPPKLLGDDLFVDAANVTNEPTGAALDYLRDRVHPLATCIYVYSVTHLPFTKACLGRVNPQRYAELLNVVVRARELERFRDARLDRNLTHLFTNSIPAGRARFSVKGPDGQVSTFLRASIFPIEPESPGHVNERIVRAASNTERRQIIAETVADGCRTALETMIGGAIRKTAGNGREVKCSLAIAALLRDRSPGAANPPSLPGSAATGSAAPGSAAPGSAAGGPAVKDPGPGLAEVCGCCALHRGTPGELSRTLSARLGEDRAVDWPGEDDPPVVTAPPAFRKSAVPQEPLDATVWPRARRSDGSAEDPPRADRARPTVSLLFSGGVFRGVYQMGALNALNEAGIEPDVIAGASVGSITAAMIARVFSNPRTPAGLRERRKRIARLAAVYLGVDRLVMTDRFADFIRAVTVRAAHTQFSIRDADRVFRRYDGARAGVYERELRRVVAGLERLCYVSPFELKDLVEAIRRQQYGRTSMLAGDYLQEWLNRLGVSNQVLGAEPLQLLIEQYVLDGLRHAPNAPANVPFADAEFDVFRRSGICFLATVTNLTGGGLEVLGSNQLKQCRRDELLGQSLLASSAFPGVFRPRWSWEFLPGDGSMDRYIDGGVTDNLPLDAVAEFLHEAAKRQVIARRPAVNGLAVPHLLLATSLEPRLESLSVTEIERELSRPGLSPDSIRELERERAWRRKQLRELSNDWPKLYRRASRLKYNLKLDVYAEAQQALRQIVQARGPAPDCFDPVDLEVIAVKPAWLCGTFAFHPMMGFRRKRQAQSIAHGCRTTLLQLGRLYSDPHRRDPQTGVPWADLWGLTKTRLPGSAVVDRTPPPIRAEGLKPGDCWIRPGTPCPFGRAEAEKALDGTQAKADMAQTVTELDRIYQLCGKGSTHQPANE